MAEFTKYLRLMKPQGNEYYNVENFNHNAELIDKETEKLNTAVTKIQEGATREKAGIVQFGTEEGKALEGMMLARLAGCIGYGGDIQTAGTKDINYLYYDRNTRKMYKCLNQNSDVSANVANFIPLDNNSLLERLENLYTFKQEILSEKRAYIARIGKISNILIVTILSTGERDLNYLEPDYVAIQNFKVKDSYSSITGNKGSAGQLVIENNRIKVIATDETKRLSHSFMGQIITQII